MVSVVCYEAMEFDYIWILYASNSQAGYSPSAENSPCELHFNTVLTEFLVFFPEKI